MNKKLKIYSVLMAIVLVGSAITLTFNYESYSCDKRDGEVLTLDSLKEEFAKVDRKTVVNVDTTGGKRDTIGTSSSWTVQFKPTFEVTVPVRPIRGANDKFLYSSVKGEPCIDYILTNTLLSCATLPLLIWLLVIILKVIRSVYKGEIFVSQIAKRLETAGWLLVAFWFLANVVGYIQIQILRKAILMAYYDIYWQPASINFVIFGLVLMILSQIILKGKDLKDEQELTI